MIVDVSMTFLILLSFIVILEMSVNFMLFHQSGPNTSTLNLPSGYWHMSTCLRSIVISDHSLRPECLENYETFKNEEAFQFLLQIICGLKSPLIGETEVLGQFKNFIKTHQKSLSLNVKSIFKLVLKEAKSIRTDHLQNLGCSSYGSLLRKYIHESNEPITMVGAGSLAIDILPWFNKRKSSIEVYTRNVSKHEEVGRISSNVSLLELEKINYVRGGILIIAAPVSNEWLNENSNLNTFSKIFDLRGESSLSSLDFSQVLSLGQLFSDIEKNKEKALKIKKNVLVAIKESTLKISHMERQRPFGWEDLCQYA